MGFLRLTPKDCSALGQLILQYIAENQISMSELARRAGCTQPGLRAACLKGTSPTDSTLRKLSKVLGVHHARLYLLAYGDRSKALEEESDDSLFEDLFEVVEQIIGRLPEERRPPKPKITDAVLKMMKEMGFT